MGRLAIDTSAQSGRLTVKNTFLDLVGSDGEESPRVHVATSLRTRSSSDPGLYERICQEEMKESMAEQEVIVMSGFSDAETEEDVQLPTSPLTPPAEIPSDSASTLSAESAMDSVNGALECQSPSGDPTPATLNHFLEEIRAAHGKTSSAGSHGGTSGSSGSATPQLQQQMDKLVQENARLAEQNRQLMESCRQASSAATLATAVPYCAPPTINLPFCPPMGADLAQPWWGNAAERAGVHQQMFCIAAPVLTLQQFPQMSQPTTPPFCNPNRNQKPQRPKLQSQRQQPHYEQQAMPQDAGKQRKGARSSVEDVAEEQGAEAALDDDTSRTTVMLRNLPNNYSRTMVIEMIDSEGFKGQYDFVYLPMDFNTQACLGYCFVNMLDAEAAQRFWVTFKGYSRWVIPSRKLCGVSWSNPHQGLQSNLDRYRNSPVMHEAVPEDYKPMLFVDGVPAPFPEPTKKIRAPRLRTVSTR